jgi:poly(A) polymerase
LSWRIGAEALSILKKLDSLLGERQINAWVVGGLVRDMLIGRPTGDIDIAIAGDALVRGRELADLMEGKYVLLDEVHGIARIVLPDRSRTDDQWCIDLSTLNGDILRDLARRDFTIDAMAVKLGSLAAGSEGIEIIDPYGGQRDLDARLIKALSEEVFVEDPARMLRAVRLAAELGFAIEPETREMVLRRHSLAAGVAGERVREELLKVLASPHAGEYIIWLDDLRVLTALIPELEPARGMEQPAEHHWDVLRHSLETVRAVDFLLKSGTWEYVSADVLKEVPRSEELSAHLAEEVNSGSIRLQLMKLAALLHDISKPETKILSGEKVRFFGHSAQGAGVAAAILERLRFSHREISLVEIMVRHHMRPTQMSNEGLPTRKAIYRFFRDTGSAGLEVLYLSLADHLAARGPDLDFIQWGWHTQQVKSIMEGYFQQPRMVKPVKLLDGHDLIRLYGLKPGPQIRELLEAVREAQAAGEIVSREEALSYVKNRILYRE